MYLVRLLDAVGREYAIRVPATTGTSAAWRALKRARALYGDLGFQALDTQEV